MSNKRETVNVPESKGKHFRLYIKIKFKGYDFNMIK